MGTRTITVNSAWLLKPAGSDSLNKADDEMRAERAAFQERISEEHYFDLSGTQTSHGIHKPGSARALVASAPPEYRLDGTSRFTTTLDKGLLTIDTTDGCMLYLDTANGSGIDVWKNVNPNDAPGDYSIAGDLNVGTDGNIGRDLTIGRHLTLGGITTQEVSFSITATYQDIYNYFSSIMGSSSWGLKVYASNVIRNTSACPFTFPVGYIYLNTSTMSFVSTALGSSASYMLKSVDITNSGSVVARSRATVFGGAGTWTGADTTFYPASTQTNAVIKFVYSTFVTDNY